jgi:urea transporter
VVVGAIVVVEGSVVTGIVVLGAIVVVTTEVETLVATGGSVVGVGGRLATVLTGAWATVVAGAAGTDVATAPVRLGWRWTTRATMPTARPTAITVVTIHELTDTAQRRMRSSLPTRVDSTA